MQNIEAVQFETLFDKRLQMYDSDQEMVKEEAREQQEAVKRLQDANAAFVNTRRGDQSTKQREQALQSLENAYSKYKEIISNLDTGRKFYNDLAKLVSRFRDDCRSFAYQRKQEAAQIEGYVANPTRSKPDTDVQQRPYHVHELDESAARQLELAAAATAGRRAEPKLWCSGARRGALDGTDAYAGQRRPACGHVDA